MKTRMLLFVAAVATVSIAGCQPSFAPVSLVQDLRVLAISSEPPELLVPSIAISDAEVPTAQLSLLWADPAAPSMPTTWTLRVCALGGRYAPGAGEVRDLGESCVEKADATVVSSGTALPGERITVAVQPTVALLMRAVELDPLRSYDGRASLTAEWEIGLPGQPRYVIAQKRLHYALLVLPNGDPNPIVANTNPALARMSAIRNPASMTDRQESDLVLYDAPLPPNATPSLTLNANEEIELAPHFAEGAKESYSVKTFTGSYKTLEETIQISFFATDGSFSRETTGAAERNQIGQERKGLETEWTASKKSSVTQPSGASRPVTLWFVLRDERGGAHWKTALILVNETTTQ